MRYLLSSATLMLWVVLCHAQTAIRDSVQNVTLDTMEVTAPAGPQVYRASAPRAWDIKNTRIALTFNWSQRTAEAREWIKLRPYFYATDTLELDAKGMHIDSVMLVGKKVSTSVNYTYHDDKIKIRFDREYRAADSIELYLRYTAMPYANRWAAAAR